MREIKFRAWDGKKMLNNALPWSWDAVIQKGSHKCVASTRPPFSNAIGEAKFEVYASMINNVVVEQSTGLKDCKGKEIYEGDIVYWPDSGWNMHKFEIKWDEVETGWQACTKRRGSMVIDNEMEVIGNIHQDHELLEE